MPYLENIERIIGCQKKTPVIGARRHIARLESCSVATQLGLLGGLIEKHHPRERTRRRRRRSQISSGKFAFVARYQIHAARELFGQQIHCVSLRTSPSLKYLLRRVFDQRERVQPLVESSREIAVQEVASLRGILATKAPIAAVSSESAGRADGRPSAAESFRAIKYLSKFSLGIVLKEQVVSHWRALVAWQTPRAQMSV